MFSPCVQRLGSLPTGPSVFPAPQKAPCQKRLRPSLRRPGSGARRRTRRPSTPRALCLKRLSWGDELLVPETQINGLLQKVMPLSALCDEDETCELFNIVMNIKRIKKSGRGWNKRKSPLWTEVESLQSVQDLLCCLQLKDKKHKKLAQCSYKALKKHGPVKMQRMRAPDTRVQPRPPVPRVAGSGTPSVPMADLLELAAKLAREQGLVFNS